MSVKSFYARLIGVLLVAMLVIGALPALDAKADVTDGLGAGAGTGSGVATYQRDKNYVEVTPDDVQVWDNGKGVSISNGSGIISLPYRSDDYLVAISKYLADDGEYTTQVDVWFYGYISTSSNCYRELYYSDTVQTGADGSVLLPIGASSQYCYASSVWQRDYYCVRMRDNLFMSSSTEWVSEPSIYITDAGSTVRSSSQSAYYIYATPYFSGKYVIYSSHCEEYTNTTMHGFPVNLLPNAPQGDGDTSIPYKTTFRMLTDGAVAYNTFYYTSCYKSGADTISAAGTIRCDSTVLATGATTRMVLNAPQLLCQISSYGTAYDIAYTNDDNLCSLLGIEKPSELRWNVSAQQWVSPLWDDILNGGAVDFDDVPDTDVINPDGTSPFESSDTVPTISGLSVSAVGSDATISYADFTKLYGSSLMHVSTSADNAADCWGLGSKLTWSIGSDPDGVTTKLQVVAKMTVQTAGGANKTHQVIVQDYDGTHPGNSTAFKISAGIGSATISLYDLIIALEEQNSEYVRTPPAKLIGVVYYLTPFYYSDGTYYRGKTVSTAHSVNKTFASVPVDDSPLEGIGDPWDAATSDNMFEAIKSLGSYIKQGIANAVSSVGSFFSGVLNSARSILNSLGSIPSLLSDLFDFLPDEFLAAVGVGLSLWLLPSLLGLARSGLKALGGLCSTLFSFISTFFGG